MARIRSVKPEFWTDLKLARMSRDARLLYIALWNQSDEHGRLHGDPRYVKGHCLPYDDDLSLAAVDGLLEELSRAGRLVRYTVDGDPYLFLPNLGKHQRLETEKVPSRLPPPPADLPPPDGNRRSEDVSESRADESARRTDESAPAAEPSEPIVALQVAGGMEHVAGSKGQGTGARGAQTSPDFTEFWQTYPRREGKGLAEKSYAKAVKAGTSPDDLLAGARRYAERVAEEDPRFTAMPATWLNQRRWEDEPPPASTGRFGRRPVGDGRASFTEAEYLADGPFTKRGGAA